jgi:hypothetical protein
LAALAALVLLTPTIQADPVLTPVKAAILKRDLQKAEDQYVTQVAKIVGTRESVVRRALPDRARITDPVNRVISALERDLGKPLTDEQKNAIRIAENDYLAARNEAEINAYRK